MTRPRQLGQSRFPAASLLPEFRPSRWKHCIAALPTLTRILGRWILMDQIAHADTLQALDQKHDHLLDELDSLISEVEQTLVSVTPKKDSSDD